MCQSQQSHSGTSTGAAFGDELNPGGMKRFLQGQCRSRASIRRCCIVVESTREACRKMDSDMRILVITLSITLHPLFAATGLSEDGKHQPTEMSSGLSLIVDDYARFTSLSDHERALVPYGVPCPRGIDGDTVISFPNDPWRGTVWEGYCGERGKVRFADGLCLKPLRGVDYLSNIHRSLVGLIRTAFVQAERSLFPLPRPRCECASKDGQTAESGESSHFVPPDPPTQNNSRVTPFPMAPMPTVPVSPSDPGYAKTITPDLLEGRKGDSESELAEDPVPEPPLEQPVIEPESRPAVPSSSLPRNTLKPRKKSGTDGQEPVTVPAVDSPSQSQPVSPASELPRNHLPRTKSTEDDSAKLSVIRIRSVGR